MSLPLEVTERMKKEVCLFSGRYGGVLKDADADLEVEGVSYGVSVNETERIAEPRCLELFSLIAEHAAPGGDMEGSVYLCGGGSRLEGLANVAEEFFGLPAAVVTPAGVDGLVELAGDAGWVTGAGLLFEGMDLIADYRDNRVNGYFNRIINGFRKVVC
jgi:cell division ATPase FtsA